MNSDYSIVIPSSRPELRIETQLHLKNQGFDSIIHDGTGYPSFSKLINDAIVECQTDCIIICNDKARPTSSQIEKMINLHESGFGFVALYSFGFFCLSKFLIDKIGFLDERFTNGNYEDCDFIRRLALHDIAFYNKYEIEYKVVPSSWSTLGSKIFYEQKWKEANPPDDLICIKNLDELEYEYSLGEFKNRKFKPFSETIIDEASNWFLNVKIETLPGIK